ncbi:hypothetical protein M3J09_013625 [Ascochyta lentis]
MSQMTHPAALTWQRDNLMFLEFFNLTPYSNLSLAHSLKADDLKTIKLYPLLRSIKCLAHFPLVLSNKKPQKMSLENIRTLKHSDTKPLLPTLVPGSHHFPLRKLLKYASR